MALPLQGKMLLHASCLVARFIKDLWINRQTFLFRVYILVVGYLSCCSLLEICNSSSLFMVGREIRVDAERIWRQMQEVAVGNYMEFISTSDDALFFIWDQLTGFHKHLESLSFTELKYLLLGLVATGPTFFIPLLLVGKEIGANFLTPSHVSSTNELVIVWDPEVGRTNPS